MSSVPPTSGPTRSGERHAGGPEPDEPRFAGPAARPRVGPALLRLALAGCCLLLAAAAVPAQDPPTAPGPVRFGSANFDPHAPGDDRGTIKAVFSHPQALQISWRPPASDGGSTVTGYRVHWYETSDYAGTKTSVEVRASGGGIHHHYLTGLKNGVEYAVGVTAVNAVGEGPFLGGDGNALASLPFTRPRDAYFINTPTARHNMEVRNLAVAVHAPNVLRVTWSRPSGTRVLDYYVVRWSSPASAGALVNKSANVSNSATSYDIPNLVVGHRYSIAVETESRHDSAAEGGERTSAFTSGTAVGVPGTPGGVTVLGTDGALEVRWTKPDDGGSPIVGYRMEWRHDGKQVGTGATPGPDATSHTIPDLTNGNEYEVRFRARNRYFDGPWATGRDKPFKNTRPSFGTATVGKPVFAVGVPATLTLPAATAGDYGLTYSLTPEVPGLTFDASKRTLSGTATTVGEHGMTWRADDGDRFTGDDDAAVLDFTLGVEANSAPSAGALAKTTPEDTALALAAADFRSVFTDPDFKDGLKAATIVSLPDAGAGALTLGGAAVTAGQTVPAARLIDLVFTPAENYAGAATFKFTLRDIADADSAAATATVTVSPVADPPAADAGDDQLTVPAAGTVTLDGGASDPDAGAVLTTAWTQTSGATVTLSDASALAPTFTAPSPADSVTLVFRLTVTDETGLSASDDVTVKVNANNTPVVNEQIGDLGFLEAVGYWNVFMKPIDPLLQHFPDPSYNAFADPDGDPLTYTAASANPLVATAEAKWSSHFESDYVQVKPEGVGITTVSVTATDDDGASVTQSFRVLVLATPPDTVTAAAGARSARVTWDALPAAQRAVILRYQLRIVRFDAETGNPLRGVWRDIPGSSGQTTGYTVPNLPGGERRRIEVRAVLNESFIAELRPHVYLPMGHAEVTALASNRPPVATAAIPGQTLAAPAKYNGRSFNLADYFSDPDGDTLTLTLTSESSHATRELDGGTLRLTAASAGTDTVTVTATDPAGLTAKQSFAVRVEELDTIRLRLHTRNNALHTVLIAEWDALPGKDQYRARVAEVGTAQPFRSLNPTTVGGVTSFRLKGHLPDSTPFKTDTRYLVEVEHELLGVRGSGTVATQDGVGAPNEYRRDIWWYPGDGQVTLRWNLDTATQRAAWEDILVQYGRVDSSPRPWAPCCTTEVFFGLGETGGVIDGLANGVAYRFRAGVHRRATTEQPGRTVSFFIPHPFEVTPQGPDRAPFAVGALPGLVLQLSGSGRTLDLSQSFRDPEDGELTYAAEASAAGIVDAAVEEASLRLTPRAGGSVKLTVTATDGAGNRASRAFDVWVNRPPVNSREIGRITVHGESRAGSATIIFLPGYVTDPDGDPLSFSFTATGGVATIALEDSRSAPGTEERQWLSATSGTRPGRMTVQVTASDGRGGTLTVPVRVEVLGDDRSIWIESPGETVEEGEAAEFTVRLGQAATVPLAVNVATADGTAAAGADYTARTAAAVTIPAGETSATVSVATLDDALVEGKETFSIAVSDPGTLPDWVSISSTGNSVGIGIADADSVSVGIAAGSKSVAEGDAATFTVTAAEGGAPTDDVAVTYELAGAATAGTDYTAPGGTLTIPAGSTSATITIETLKDAVFDPDEALTVKLTGATTAKGAAAVGEPVSATTTITEASVIAVSLTATQPAYEGDYSYVAIRPSAVAAVAIPFAWRFRDLTATVGTDYNAWRPERATLSPYFTGFLTSVRTFPDDVVEGDETYEIVLSETSSGLPDGVILHPDANRVTITIPDDDTSTVTIADAAANEGNAIIFTVTLGNAVQGGLTVTPHFTDGTAAAGTDYTPNTSALVFAGAAGETQRFVVATTEDAEEEADETFTVGLTVSGAPGPVTATGTATGTIANDDDDGVPTLRIADASADEGDAITFAVTLDQAVPGGMTVTPGFTDGTATGGTDYTENTSALTFAGRAGEQQTFTVATTEDTDEEPDETFTVDLTVSGASETVTATDTATGTITDDDRTPAVTIEDASAVEGNAIAFTVTLDQAVAGGLTVTPGFTDVTATKGTDYTENTAALAFAGTAGERQTFTVATTADTEEEADETFTVNLTVSGTSTEVTATDTATGAISDPGELGKRIELTGSNAAAVEGDSMTLEISLLSDVSTVAAPQDLTIYWTTSDDSAAAGSDYAAATKAAVTIPAGQTSATFEVKTLEDDVAEGVEFFDIRYEAAEDVPAYLALGSEFASGTLAGIVDDDRASLTIEDASADEGGAVTFTVTLDNTVQDGLTVTPAFTDVNSTKGDDYTENTAALSFAGTAGETQTFTVQTTGDDAVEGDETFTVGLAVSGTSATVTASDTATGTITDDDGAVVTVAAASASEGEAITFAVKVGAAVPGGFSVTPGFADGTATAGADYARNTDALSFAGAAGETQSFTVSTIEDTVAEGDETFMVSLAVTGASIALKATDTATGTIADDDTAAVTVGDAGATEGGSLTFTVTLDEAVAGGLTVTPGFTDATATRDADYTGNTAAIAFAGTAGETQTFTVSTTDDTDVEAPETFTASLAVSGTAATVTAADTAVGTITDNDSAAVTVGDSGAAEGDPLRFTVTLDKAVAGGLTVTPSFTDGTAVRGTDYTENTAALTFAGTAGETRTFTVATTHDADLEGDETFTVGLAVSGTGANVTAADTATGTIADDDSAAVTVEDASADEGGAVTFTVTLDRAVRGGLTVTPGFTDVSATAGADYTANTSPLSFTGTAGETRTFTVATTEDGAVEGDETFTVGLEVSQTAFDVTASDTATGTITDDDGAVVTVADASAGEGAAIAFRVTVGAAVPGGFSVTPGFTDGTATKGEDYTENTSPLRFTGTAGETRALAVATIPDAEVEGDETFTVSLAVTGASIALKATDTATGTIADDDNAAVTVEDASAAEGGPLTFTVTLDTAVPGGLTVTPGFTDGTASRGTDYTGNPAALAFTGTAGETKTFSVATTADAVVEADETFTVGLTVSGTTATVTATDTATGTITNDDSATASLTLTPASIGENGGSSAVAAALDAAAGVDVTLTVSAAPAPPAAEADFTQSGTELTIAAGQTTSTGTVTLAAVDNDVVAADREVTVSATVSGPAGVAAPADLTLTITEDDAATLGFDSTAVSVTEGGKASLTVELTKAAASDVTFSWQTADGTAESSDYTAQTATEVTIAAGATSAALEVQTTGDAVTEGGETFTVTISASDLPDGVTLGTDAVATVTITDDDSAAVTVADASAAEGDEITFTVTLDTAVAGGLTVTPGFADGTATGADYTGEKAELQFSGTAGEAKTFTVATTEDEVVEGDEAFTVSLQVAGTSFEVAATDTATGTILEDDSATVTIDDAVAAEGESLGFTITLHGTVEGGLTVTPSFTDVTTEKGADYTENTTPLTFNGTGGETATFTVDAAKDDEDEGAETFTVGLGVSDAPEGVTGADTATGTITDEGVVVLTVDDAAAAEGESLNFRVKLSQAVKDGLTVTPGFTDGTATEGADYEANTAELKFAGNAGEEHIFTVATIEDEVADAARTFTVGLTVSGTSTEVVATDTARGTITDDDNATLGFDPDAVSVAEGGKASFTVELSKEAASDVTFSWRTADGTAGTSDFTAQAATDVTIAAGATSAPLEVQTTQDTVVEAGETFTVTIGASSLPAGVSLGAAAATATITDDDRAAVTVADAGAAEGDALTFTVTLDKAVSGGLTVTPEFTDVTATEGTDYTENTAALTFAGTAQETRTFTVATTQDESVEADETFTVGLEVSETSGAVTATAATGTITNEDTATLGFDPARVRVIEGGKASFTVELTKAAPSDVTFSWQTADGTAGSADYTAQAATNVTIEAGETSATLEVQTAQDTAVEGGETFTATISASSLPDGVALGAATATATITDDDSPSIALSVSPEYIQEGQHAAQVTLTATRDGTAGDHSVTLSVGGGTATDGTDYTIGPFNETLRIGPGESTASVPLTFTVDADGLDEGNESVILSGTASGANVGDAVVTIGDPEDITLAVAPTTIAEDAGATSVTVTAMLSGARDTATAVTLDLAGSATDPADYAATSPLPAVTIPRGQTRADATLTVTPVDDALVEADETITVNGRSGSRSVAPATVTLTDNDGSAAVTVEDASADEGEQITFTVTLDKAVAGGLKVTPSFTDGTAVAGTDYTENTAALTFAGTAGETKTFTVATTEDTTQEHHETFTVGLTVSGTSATVTDTDTATGTINNDDGAHAAVTVADVSAAEGDALTFTVTLDNAIEGGLTVTPSFTDGTAVEGTDYTENTAALTFAGTAGETQSFTVATTEDTVVEANETFTVGLAVSGTTADVTDTDTATGTITNDDGAAAVTVEDTSAEEGDALTFTVTLDKAVDGGLKVTPSFTDGTATEGTDYTENTAALTFAGTAGETQSFTVSTTEDTTKEHHETFTVGLAVSETSAEVTATDTATGTINNDDGALAAVTIEDAAAEEGDALTFTVTLDNAVDGGLTVTPSFTDGTATKGTDYTENTAALTFAGTAGETQSFTVSTTEDSTQEHHETFTVSLAVSGTSATVTDTDTATGTINNDDGAHAAVTVADVSAAEGDALTFTVTLDNAIEGGLTVTPSFTDGTAVEGTDYTENTAALTFAGTAGETQSFTVATTEDTVVEANETFTVGLAVSGTTADVTDTDTATGTITNDDGAAAVTVEDTSAEEGDALTFTVTLDKAVDGGLKVTPSFTDGTATEGTDYTENTAALTFAGTAGETQSFTVSTTEDTTKEHHETFTVGLAVSETSAEVTATDTATGTINNDDGALAAVTIEDVSAEEGDALTFTVTLDNAVDGGLTVTPGFTDGTATKGTDYTENTTALTFAGTAGETQSFTVSTTEDSTQEHHETFTVGLEVSGTTATVTATDTATGTINNDDGAHAAVTVADVSADEGDSLTFTVTLDKAIAGGLKVTPSFTDGTATEGTDYTGNTVLTFTGTANETQTFTVATTEDTVVEANETFTVGLAVSGTTADVTDTDTATGTITNDDGAAAVTIGDAAAEEGDALTFTVTLDKAVDGGLTVTPSFTDGTAVEGTDYTENTAALTFAGTAGETQSFTVATTEDTDKEHHETFTVGLAVSETSAEVTATDTATGTINNDDGALAAVTIEDVSAEEGDALTFTVTLDNAVDGGLTVTPGFTDGTATKGTDYTENTAALTFAGTAGETQSFTVSTTEDSTQEHHETFTVSLEVSGTSATVTDTDTATGTINNDDGAHAAVTVADVSADEGDSLTFTVTLDKAIAGGLKVTPSFTDGTAVGGTDYTANTATLTFTGTAKETQTFTVATTEDTVAEADETFTVGLAVSGTTADVTDTDTATGTITNDDTATLGFDSTAVSVTEGGKASLTVELSNAASSDVTFSWQTAHGTAESSDYTAQAATSVTIAAGSTSATLEVQTAGDELVEGDETFTVTISASSLPAGVTLDTDATATVTVTEDDAATLAFDATAVSVAEGGKASLTVELSQTAANDVTFSWSTTDGTAVSGDYTAQAATSVTIAAGDTSATLAVQTTEDALAEAGETFTVTISASSLPAGVTLGTAVTATVTITDDDGAAVTIADAAASEGDAITFSVKLDNAVPGGFTVAPGFTDGTATKGTDYTENTAALTFAGTAGETQSFTVSTTEDSTQEHHETFTVSLEVSGTSATVTDTDTATGTITNDDGAHAAVTVADVSADEGDALTFTVTLDKAIAGGLKVTPSFTDGTAVEGTDYTANTDRPHLRRDGGRDADVHRRHHRGHRGRGRRDLHRRPRRLRHHRGRHRHRHRHRHHHQRRRRRGGDRSGTPRPRRATR